MLNLEKIPLHLSFKHKKCTAVKIWSLFDY